MPAYIAQEVNILEPVEPFGVVHHRRCSCAVPERKKPLEALQDRTLVCLNLLWRQELACFFLAGWISDFGGATAHQHNGFVPRLLQAAKSHNLHKTTDVQTRCRAIKPDVSCHAALAQAVIESRWVGAVIILSPRYPCPEEVRPELRRCVGHRMLSDPRAESSSLL